MMSYAVEGAFQPSFLPSRWRMFGSAQKMVELVDLLFQSLHCYNLKNMNFTNLTTSWALFFCDKADEGGGREEVWNSNLPGKPPRVDNTRVGSLPDSILSLAQDSNLQFSKKSNFSADRWQLSVTMYVQFLHQMFWMLKHTIVVWDVHLHMVASICRVQLDDMQKCNVTNCPCQKKSCLVYTKTAIMI